MRSVTVSGAYRNTEGEPVSLQLRFTPTSTLKSSIDNVIVLDESIYSLTDGHGKFSVSLYPRQTGLSPARFLYEVQEILGRRVIKTWFMRLDETTPDNVSLPAIYPYNAPPPEDIEIYPTIEDVRVIAADLDKPIYVAATDAYALASSNAEVLEDKLDNSDIGVTVPSLVNGLIPSSQVPAIRFQQVWVATSQAEMLALNLAVVGDLCQRTDNGTSFVLGVADPSVLAHWYVLSSSFSVTSVNGQTGLVQLGALDIGAATSDHNHEVLSGDHYIATYIRGGIVNAMEKLDVSDHGDAVVVDTRSINFVDAAGQTLYTVNPHNATPWSPFAITPLNEAMSPVTVGSCTAQARPFSPDVNEVTAVITGWTDGHAFQINTSSALSGVYTGLWGSWSALLPNGRPLGAGTAVVNTSKLIELVGVPEMLAANPGTARSGLTFNVYGRYHSAYVGTAELVPDPNNNYRLQIGTVTRGTLDAEIVGQWPVQTMNLVLPDNDDVTIATNSVQETMLTPDVRTKLNSKVDNVLVLKTADPVPPGTLPGTLVVRYTPTVVAAAAATALNGAGNISRLQIGQQTGSADAAYTIANPTNRAIGDLLVFIGTGQSSTNSATAWTLPAGWVNRWQANSARKSVIATYSIVDAAALSALGSTSLVKAPSDAGTGRGAYTMFRVTGADLTNPWAGGQPGNGLASGTTSSLTTNPLLASSPVGLKMMFVTENWSTGVTLQTGSFGTMSMFDDFFATHTTTAATTTIGLGNGAGNGLTTIPGETYTLPSAASAAICGCLFGIKSKP